MKLEIDKQTDQLVLTVPTTNDKDHIIRMVLPKTNIHYWYPFNINFYYQHSAAKNFLYLIEGNDYLGPNIYGAGILKKSKPVGDKDGTLYHDKVCQCNLQTIEKAKAMNLPVITEEFTSNDLKNGFLDVRDKLEEIKDQVFKRNIHKFNQGKDHMSIPDEEYLLKHMNSKEEDTFTFLGEVLGMFGVMRKLIGM